MRPVACECPPEGHAPGCLNDPLNRFTGIARRGQAYERLGKLMQQPETGIIELAQAARTCGLRLEYRFTMEPPEPEECTHQWTYSLGDTHKRCVACGELRALDDSSEEYL